MQTIKNKVLQFAIDTLSRYGIVGRDTINAVTEEMDVK